MQPHVWLQVERVTKVRKKRWPNKSKAELIHLAQTFFKTQDLSRAEVSRLCMILERAEDWPDNSYKPEVHESVDPRQLTQYPFSTPDQLLDGLMIMLEFQPGTSVLDIGCANGRLAAHIHPDCLYEGHDIDETALAEARASFPHQQFQESSVYDWLYAEPETSYNVVFTHFSNFIWDAETLPTCLEAQKGSTQIRSQEALVELAVKCCGHGGFVICVLDEYLNLEIAAWLRERGVILAELEVVDHTLLIFRKGARKGKGVQASFDTYEAYIDWCLSDQAPRLTTPICQQDPRPLSLRHWNIELEKPVGLGKLPEESTRALTSWLFRSKHGVDIRWGSLEHVISFMADRAYRSIDANWPRIMKTFRESFLDLKAYQQLRVDRTPSQLFDVPLDIQEEPALTRWLDKRARNLSHTLQPYPQRKNRENQYLTLGSGDWLKQTIPDGSTVDWKVKFAESDHVNRKYPRLHLEKP